MNIPSMMQYKSSRIWQILNRIYDCYLFPSSLTLRRRLETAEINKTAVLLGTPIHRNIGDHLLACAEIAFLKNECYYTEVIEIPTRFLLNNVLAIEKMIPKEMPVYITGGGWMGNTWPEDQEKLEIILDTFKLHKVIILPQTVYYDNNIDIEEVNKTRRVYSCVDELLIFCRDESSYHSVNRLFRCSNIKTSFKPDMALYLDPKSKTDSASRTVICCLREDREKATKYKWTELIDEYSQKFNYRFVNDSTIYSRAIPIWMRRIRVNSIIKSFRNANLIITDRLHGMIFAYLSSTPCIAIDNSTHKVSGVYNAWLRKDGSVMVIQDSLDKEEFTQIINNLNNREKTSFDNTILKEEFKAMSTEINDFIRRNLE